jgi:hypothetical protein
VGKVTEWHVDHIASALGLGAGEVLNWVNGETDPPLRPMPPRDRGTEADPIWEPNTIEPWLNLLIDLRDSETAVEVRTVVTPFVETDAEGRISSLAARICPDAYKAHAAGVPEDEWRASLEGWHPESLAWKAAIDQVETELKDHSLWPW